MNVTEIIQKYLMENNFDGLFYEGECACELSDLFPCGGEYIVDCEPGYREKCNCDKGCDFHIG